MANSQQCAWTEAPEDSVDVVAPHAMKMGWLEKEAEESMMGKKWQPKFAILTGWDGLEAHLFYYKTQTDKEAGGICFVSEMTIEENPDPKIFTLQGCQRRFKFRCANQELARSWRQAIQEAQTNGGHDCKCGEATIAWVKDKHSKTCHQCKRVFSVTLSKQHCGCCGRVFCSECTGGDKIKLQPYIKEVRCCHPCNKKQCQLIARRNEQRRRLQVFVAKYLELLETGSHFKDPDGHVQRTLCLDNMPHVSLQCRHLCMTEQIDPDALADLMQQEAAEKAKGFASKMMAMPYKAFNSLRGVKDMDHQQNALKVSIT